MRDMMSKEVIEDCYAQYGAVNLSFVENLEFYTIAQLKKMGAMYKIGRLSGKRHADLATYLAAEIPTHAENIIPFLDVEAIKILKKLIKRGPFIVETLDYIGVEQLVFAGLVVISKIETAAARFENNRYIPAAYDLSIAIPEGAEGIIKKILSPKLSPELLVEQKVWQYLQMATHIYGFISYEELANIYNKQNQRHFAPPALFHSIAKRLDNKLFSYSMNKQFIWHENIAEKDISYYLKNIEQYKRFEPTPIMAEKYAEVDFMKYFPTALQMFKLLEKICGEKQAIIIFERIIYHIHSESKPSEMIHEFRLHYELDEKLDNNFLLFFELYTEMNNSIRHWFLKGNTPNEVYSPYEQEAKGRGVLN